VPVVEDYWSGVLRRLQAEVDVFNELITHAGERGRENELSFARLLAGLVPRRYGIGSGLLIDSKDHYSQQTDIVIYDHADEPAILAQTSQVLFPIENVRACIEVKTRVGAEEVQDCAKKVGSMAELESLQPNTPLYALIGYRATSNPPAITKQLLNLPAEQRPNLVCVIDIGFVAGDAKTLRLEPSSTDYVGGVTALHTRNDKGERVAGTYLQPEKGKTSHLFRGVTYPAVKVGADLVVAEPSRALLAFCEALVRNLALRDGREVPAISHYVTSVARDLLLLT
jgi:hypothetical protein